MEIQEEEVVAFPAIKEMITGMIDRGPKAWDIPNEVYVLTGTVDEPDRVLVRSIPINNSGSGDMVALLHKMAKVGLPPSVIGVMVISETLRHLTYDELAEVPDSPVAMIHTTADALAEMEGDEEAQEARRTELYERAKKVYYQMVSTVAPSSLPDHMTIESRHIMGALRDGVLFKAELERRSGKLSYDETTPSETGGNLPEALAACFGLKVMSREEFHRKMTEDSDEHS